MEVESGQRMAGLKKMEIVCQDEVPSGIYDEQEREENLVGRMQRGCQFCSAMGKVYSAFRKIGRRRLKSKANHGVN